MSFGTALRKSNRKRGKMVVLAKVGEIGLGFVSVLPPKSEICYTLASGLLQAPRSPSHQHKNDLSSIQAKK